MILDSIIIYYMLLETSGRMKITSNNKINSIQGHHIPFNLNKTLITIKPTKEMINIDPIGPEIINNHFGFEFVSIPPLGPGFLDIRFWNFLMGLSGLTCTWRAVEPLDSNVRSINGPG